jgi:hypothetical protein
MRVHTEEKDGPPEAFWNPCGIDRLGERQGEGLLVIKVARRRHIPTKDHVATLDLRGIEFNPS